MAKERHFHYGSASRQSRARFDAETVQLLIDALQDVAIFTLDATGRTTSWNVGVHRVLGYREAEFLGLPFETTFHGDDDVAAHRPLDRARATGRCDDARWCVTKDGRRVWVASLLLPRWDEKRLRGYLAIIRDGTAIKEAHSEARELQQREQQAQVEAARANKSKDDLLTALSHELRTPLNAILGWAHLLAAGHLTDEQGKRAIQTIERNAHAQARMIDEILDLGRGIAGKLTFDMHPLTVSKMMTAVVRTVHVLAEAKHQRLSLSAAGPRRLVEGDRDHLEQVALAILSHAIDRTPAHGTIVIHVSSDDAVVDITITDSGPSISDEQLANAFEPFAWLQEPGGRRPGLARARQIVEAHRGTLTLSSSAEQTGATFRLRLPVVADGRSRPSKEVDSGAASQNPCPPRLAGICALVVEDQADSRELIEALLTRCQVRVVAVASVRDALDALDQHPIDVIISDIGLPTYDGFTLLNRVRARRPDKRGHVPAIAISARAGPTERERALEAGYQTFLAKPVEPPDVLAAVAALVCPA
jgi:PAS domain S-box-containing protein